MRFHSKTDALAKIARHLGLFDELPPLEMILALLTQAIATVVFAELADVLPRGSTSTADLTPTAESGEVDDEILADNLEDAAA